MTRDEAVQIASPLVLRGHLDALDDEQVIHIAKEIAWSQFGFASVPQQPSLMVRNRSAISVQLHLRGDSRVFVIPARRVAEVHADFWNTWCAANHDSDLLKRKQLVVQ